MRWPAQLAGGRRVAGRFWLPSAVIVAAVWALLNLTADAPPPQSSSSASGGDTAHSNSRANGSAANVNLRGDKAPSIAVIIADYEDWDNRLADTVAAINLRAAAANRAVEVAIIGSTVPYPPPFGWDPLATPANVHVLADEFIAGAAPLQSRLPVSEYYLFVPDNTIWVDYAAMSRRLVAAAAPTLNRPHGGVVIAPVHERAGTKSEPILDWCMHAAFDVKRWTLELTPASSAHLGRDDSCNFPAGRAAVLLSAGQLARFEWLRLRYRPTVQGLMLQSIVNSVPVIVELGAGLSDGPTPLYANEHNRYKRDRNEQVRQAELYRTFGIKLVKRWPVELPNGHRHTAVPAHPGGPVQHTHKPFWEWHGCRRETARCFGTILNDVPSYLVSDRWTPPCCMTKLREVARYVIQTLERCRVRYWLEGGSLLGAARAGDIIPWDYDVDLGVHRDDVERCPELQRAMAGAAFTTAEGYVWEKAREGDFCRVQYSQTNHLHVDIFPFFQKEDMMDRHGKMPSHRQDRAFPRHFLEPLGTIAFAGATASCPNSHVKFLELKFGVGVVGDPRYPQNYTS